MKKFDLKAIACVSIMIALAVVLKTFGFMIGTNMRISFYAIPLLVAGIIGGFSWGLVASLAADLIYGLFFNSYGFNPVYTISALLWGFSGGLLKQYIKSYGKLSWFFLGFIVLTASVLETCNNAIWDFALYGRGVTEMLMGYKFIVIGIKLPILISVSKLINDRVLKVLFVKE
ncbi:MAG: folate family ECF transporter S component [Bacilli bacterium]|nr:folate family ECF transporter S component [Bacilli bacterium]